MQKAVLSLILFLCLHSIAIASHGPTLRVGVFPIKPLFFTDSDGVANGFTADLINQIAKDNDWQITYIPGSWNDTLEGIKNGKLDLIAPIAHSKGRDSFLEYSQEPFFTVWGETYVLPNSGIENIIDLDKKTVAIVKGGVNGKNFKKLAAEFHIDCRYIELPSHKDVFVAVSAGKAAAGIAPNFYGIIHAASHHLVSSPIIFGASPVYFAAQEGHHKDLLAKIDETLKRWKSDKDSFYYSALSQWFSGTGTQKEVIPKWLVSTMVSSICLIIFLYAWSRILKTQVKSKTKALRDSEQKYRTLLANQNDAMFLHKVQESGFAKFSEVNTQSVELYGYTEAEFQQLTVFDISAPGVMESEEIAQANKRLRETGHHLFESVQIRKSGETFPVEISSTIINWQDQDYFLSFVREISARKKVETDLKNNEEKFRNLFEHVADYALVLKPVGEDLLIADLNESACRYHGYRREELLGQSIFTLDANAFDDEGVRWKKLHAGEPLLFETTHRRKDGSIFPVEVFIKSIEIDGGEPAFFSIERDITIRRQAEEQQQLLEAQLRQKYKMEAVGIMAGGVAHDFNNVLSIILTNLELLYRKVGKDSPLLPRIEHAKAATTRGSELVKQILAYSRQGEYISQPVQFASIVDEALKLLRSAVPTSIEILKQIEPDSYSAIIQGDAVQLEEVIINLCQNAIQSMNEKGLLSIKLKKQFFNSDNRPLPGIDPDSEYFVLEVADTGHGIPAEQIDKIFDPFFTTKKIGQGTGMGLSICQGIINKHKGQIRVVSVPEKGSSFYVYLPVTGLYQDQEQRQQLESSNDNLPKGKEHILLVDDEDSLAQSVAEALRDQGYRVTTQTSSREALEQFRSTPEDFDILITDQTMPHFTGMELSTAILSIRPELPVILCTGYSSATNPDKAKEAGIKKFFLKPLSLPKLLVAIRELLDEDISTSA